MGGCAAINCTNSDKKGFKMYKFPSEGNEFNSERRKKWIINTRRDKWKPGKSSQLCEIHFENSQFENHRADGLRKLKPNAIPTIFDVPNAPQRINTERVSLYKKPLPCSLDPESKSSRNCNNTCQESNNRTTCQQCLKYADIIEKLKKENEMLKKQLAAVKEFLNEEQVDSLIEKPNKWSNETIIKALKMRFALSVHGYEYLRNSKYPLPAYSTLTYRLRQFQLEYGIFKDILEPIQHKVSEMEPIERYCMICIDEMEIKKELDYDKNRTRMYGRITLGTEKKLAEIGSKLLVVLIRGIRSNYKQVIAAHITDGAVEAQIMKKFILEAISFCENAGLKVIALTSDMGNENRALWSSLNVAVRRTGMRSNSFVVNDNTIFVVPDVCHLLKNLWNSVLTNIIILPEDYCAEKGLPTSKVDGKSFIVKFWSSEVESITAKDLRLLYHLKREDIFPENRDKMDVSCACRFFSTKTAAAIELSVSLGRMPKNALTTAHFIRLVEEWFHLANSKLRKTSITKRNSEEKYDQLIKIISLFEDIKIGEGGWKPLNVGMIMSSLSLFDISAYLFQNGFEFVMCHRFTQDALENVFSTVRRKAGKQPTSKACLHALKALSVAQFISDVKRSNYASDSDNFLIDFFSKKKPATTTTQNTTEEDERNPACELPNQKFVTFNIHEAVSKLDPAVLQSITYIAGSSIRSKSQRLGCRESLSLRGSLPSDLQNLNKYIDLMDKGGLTRPSLEVIKLFLNCEILYQKFRNFILHNNNSVIIQKIIDDINVSFPICPNCSLKKKLTKHFFTVRNFALVNTEISKKTKRKAMYGTASEKRRKTQ